MRRCLGLPARTALLGATLLLAAPTAHADWGVGVHAGTLGLGVDVAHSVTPLFNARLGVNRYSYGFDVESDDIDYDADLELDSAHALIDFHPWAGNFRFTAGLVSNDNRIEASGTHSSGADVEGEIDFDSTAPYAGVGWGNYTRGFVPVWWSIDLGIMAQGSPRVDVSSSGLSNEQEEQEEQDLEDELEDFDTYPVLSVGLVIRF